MGALFLIFGLVFLLCLELQAAPEFLDSLDEDPFSDDGWSAEGTEESVDLFNLSDDELVFPGDEAAVPSFHPFTSSAAFHRMQRCRGTVKPLPPRAAVYEPMRVL